MREIECEAPIQVDMLVEQRCQSTPVFRFHRSFPFVLSQHLLQHQRIDEGKADLDQMQREESNFLILWPIRAVAYLII